MAKKRRDCLLTVVIKPEHCVGFTQKSRKMSELSLLEKVTFQRKQSIMLWGILYYDLKSYLLIICIVPMSEAAQNAVLATSKILFFFFFFICSQLTDNSSRKRFRTKGGLPELLCNWLLSKMMERSYHRICHKTMPLF